MDSLCYLVIGRLLIRCNDTTNFSRKFDDLGKINT